MATRRFDTNDIARTGVTITIEKKESLTWKKSAELAANIANDPKIQKVLIRLVYVANNYVQAGAIIGQATDLATEVYGQSTYFDAGVCTAALTAIISRDKSKS